MQQNLIDFHELNLVYKVGCAKHLTQMQKIAGMEPFSDIVVEFLNRVSGILLRNKEAKGYPDVVTLAFWMRKASVEHLKSRFCKTDAENTVGIEDVKNTIAAQNASVLTLGRGVAFHIAPSNVPVNYAYSLVTGLLCGNANVVRIPSKDFRQVTLINEAICQALEEYPALKEYIVLVQYGHDKSVNDALSQLADVRVIWGGDNTIREIRKSELGSRAVEVAFADRYSLAVIDADEYLSMEQKEKVANDFYNDTYLTDQNACTSPRVVIWCGKEKEAAKELFWKNLHDIVEQKYTLQEVCAVNKLTSGYLLAASNNNIKGHVKKISMQDNLIVRMKVEGLSPELMELKDNSGYFFEYDCEDILELRDICNNTHCQTIAHIGCREALISLIKSGVKGIDRIVPVGKTMDFDFIWDGYNLFERLTRTVSIGA